MYLPINAKPQEDDQTLWRRLELYDIQPGKVMRLRNGYPLGEVFWAYICGDDTASIEYISSLSYLGVKALVACYAMGKTDCVSKDMNTSNLWIYKGDGI